MRRSERLGDAARTTIRGLGELLITAGLVLLLFCVYQLIWTNVLADRATHRVTSDLRDEWRRPPSGPLKLSDKDFGKGFAFLHIPRLGRHWQVPVVQGVDLPDLARGVGHYPQTALPGEVGNFAVAGHRATNGEPFAYLDQVRARDQLVVETQQTWYTYVVDKVQIVQPTALWVLEPVPGHPHQRPSQELITLTTCNPRWASYQRLIVFGHLVAQQPTVDGRPPALTGRA